MPNVTDIKKDMEFYQDFSSLVEALKAIAVSQFHNLEKKIRTFDEFAYVLETFFDLIDINSVDHPFIRPKGVGVGVIAVTSDAGLLGGLNNRVMFAALNHLRNTQNKLIVIGTQGQRIAEGFNVPYQSFPGAEDDQRYIRAMQVRDHIIKEVAYERLGAVKLIYPFAASITNQQIIELDLLPCTEWPKENLKKTGAGSSENIKILVRLGIDVILESSVGSIVEFLAYLWVGHRLYEVFQLARLAEYAARIIHLEDSAQKIKDLEQKLKLQYFRARHEIIDQQMRELFSARSLYAK